MTPQTSPVGCTKAQYVTLQRVIAEALAPAGPVSEAQFRQAAAGYSLVVLRLASTRYAVARGRNSQVVIDRFVAAIQNPHVNHGDDYRIALGHIEATHRERSRWGIS